MNENCIAFIFARGGSKGVPKKNIRKISGKPLIVHAIDLAKKFVESASKNGATYAKFQTWSTSRLKNGAWDHDGRKEIYEKAELSIEDHQTLIKCCEENNISSDIDIGIGKKINDLEEIDL